MRSRARDVVTGLTATVVLLTVLIGVPIALAIAVGWPLPRSLPSIDAVLTALRYGHVPSSTVLQTLAVVLWVTWGLIVASVAGEIVAVARGTIASGLPGLAGLQALTARLVAAAMLLLPMAGRAAAAPAPPAPIVASEAAVAPSAAEPARPADTRTHVVQPRESLWTIAEQALGGGHRWREIAELNVGRAQPDGGRLRAGDTLIHPGWRLELPTDAAGRAATTTAVTVARGDDLWALAERHLGDGGRWPDLYEANDGRLQPDGGRLTDPDVIRPGWELTLPAEADGSAAANGSGAARRRSSRGGDGNHRSGGTAEAAGDRATDDQQPSPRPGAAPPANPRSPRDSDVARSDGDTGRSAASPAAATSLRPAAPVGDGKAEAADEDDSTAESGTQGTDVDVPVAPRPVTPAAIRRFERAEVRARPTAAPAHGSRVDELLAIGGGAVVAAGLVALVAQRRRHWLRRRCQANVPAPVDPETAELERWLRSMADHELAQRIDHVARRLADLVAAPPAAPLITAVELGERVRLHPWDPASVTPPGCTADPDGHWWTLLPEQEVAEPEATRRQLAALVSCGRTEDDALVLANLCDAGAMGLRGTDDQVREVLTSWTAELASTGADAGVHLVVAGPHDPLVERLARVSIVDDLGGALAHVRRHLEEPSQGRPRRAVVLCGAPPAGDDLERLVRLGEDPRVGVVLPTATTRRRLELDGERIRLEPEGCALVAPRWLTPDDWDRFGDLLRQPAPSSAPELLPSPLTAPGASREWTPLPPDVEDDGSVVTVGVLGPLEVDGQSTQLTPDATALLTWLAVDRTGGSAAALAATLWPTDPGAAARLDRAATEITTLLQDRVAGAVIHTDDGRIELADAVGCDLVRFDALVRCIDGGAPAAQARHMVEALALVRGEPFADGADWAHADGRALTTAAAITEVAHRLAMHALAVLDVDRAGWAVDRGLRAVPGCELLFRDRMRIADARGDVVGVETAMDELLRHLDGAWPSAETTRLHRQLRRRPPTEQHSDLPDAM